ncbi:GNAT family N-acetyltransferase [Dysgonomonas sp. ZJ709]|uniref:GNAT family N-acetyltransferase n=1 Tax=Dysgonomonas sp. ZJ709 TaxID=2709797 RepID=UPI0013EDCB96|nr:GNAT family N-acetyltransferase [Dysgonomonas sp. ZJ709]
MVFVIEKIQESHFEELISLFHEFANFEKLPEKMTNSAEQMMREKDFLLGFVAKDKNNKIAGYVTFFFAYYTWIGKSLYMDDLYIRQQYRGKGLGTILINKAISFAKESDCNKLRWQVSNWNNHAIKFYESLGATIDDVEMNCDLIL